MAIDPGSRCPCLSGLGYGECCQPLHRGLRVAATAEQLMRSRYSAFAAGETAYLLETWHPRTRPRALELDTDRVWTRLDIVRTARGGLLDADGLVEFVAYSRVGADRQRQHETSRFLRERRRWFYLDALDVAAD
ncbi:MAG TPA: YchJ family metal-binding protein [Lacisediminihabitans sp.]|uniref:YchJ family protein n=1 Tax=Lacisediminihabitans sp. TaxID=2787631 RepID=UPI002ED9F395